VVELEASCGTRSLWVEKGAHMSEVSVRYIVTDFDAAVAFYTRHLDFAVEMRPAPTFAMLRRGDLRLLLSVPSGQGGGGQAMPDGREDPSGNPIELFEPARRS
jgi:catechol 2,3-dioxygenase-like lactoylglutathione lyase family enzyme